MNHHSTLMGEARDARKQLGSATDSKTWCEAIANAATVLTMPLFKQGERFVDGNRRIFVKCCGDLIALVHHAFPDRCPITRFLHNLKDRSSVVNRFHREGAGRTTFD